MKVTFRQHWPFFRAKKNHELLLIFIDQKKGLLKIKVIKKGLVHYSFSLRIERSVVQILTTLDIHISRTQALIKCSPILVRTWTIDMLKITKKLFKFW